MKSAKTIEVKSNSCEQFPQESPPLRSKDVGRLIACISSMAVATFMVLPQEKVDGRPVPTLFKDRPTLFRIFLICALCAFLGSMGSMLIQHKPRVESFFRIICVAFMLSALVIVLYATALWNYKQEKEMKSVSPEKSLQERLLRNVLIPNLIAFLGSFSSLMVHHKPRVERVFRIYAVASVISALIFLSCTHFAFLGSFSSLMVQHKPRVERDFRIYAVDSMISALNTNVYLHLSQANGSVKRGGGSPDECRDAEGQGSRSGENQARDGQGKGSSSAESQGQDRGQGSASGENHGGDRNAQGSGSGDDEDEDERERQRRVKGDIEHGRHESNQEEINFSSIPETFMAIIGAEIIAVIDFHSNGAISSTILRLVVAINLFGFLCCMTSMLHRHRKPRAARIFGTIGIAAAGLGLLLLASLYLSSYYGWIILGLGSLAILVICVWAFRP